MIRFLRKKAFKSSSLELNGSSQIHKTVHGYRLHFLYLIDKIRIQVINFLVHIFPLI